MTPSEPPADLFTLTYDELRRLAAANLTDEPAGHTLSATALVHEAYLRLRSVPAFESRAGFFRLAAEAMRRILVDHARTKQAAKRGGGGDRFTIGDLDLAATTDPDTLLDIHDVLDKLAAEDPVSAEVARLRLFAGLSVEDTADVLGVSRATAYRDWAYARASLTAALARD